MTDRPLLETVLSADPDDDIFDNSMQQAADHTQQTTGSSINSAIGNFTNAIAGAGALGLGGAFAKSGGVVSIVLVLFFGVVTKISLDMLIHLSIITDVHSFEGLGRLAFGYSGQLAVSVSKFLYSFGCLVAYVVVLKDNLGPAVKNLAYGDVASDSAMFRFWSESFVVTWTFSFFIILPLCMLRDMTPLSNLSMLSVLSMIAIAGIILYFLLFQSEIRQPGQSIASDWLEVKSGTLECLGTFVFTFVSQHTVHLAFNSLRPRLKTYENWKRISSASIGIAAAISLTIGIGVYLTFFEATESDIFEIYPKGALVSLAQILLCATMLLTFPLPFFACRELIIINVFPDTREGIAESPAQSVGGVESIETDAEEVEGGSQLVDESSLREPLLSAVDGGSLSGDEDLVEPQVSPPDLETSVSYADLSIAVAANAINSTLLPGHQNQLKLPYHLLVTGKLWFVATGLAIAAPNLGDVLDLVGCASGTLIAFVFPAMISLRLIGWNTLAAFLLTVGGLVGSVGTYFSIRQLITDLHI